MNGGQADSAGINELAFRRYNSVEARQLRGVVEEIYVRSYVDAIASGDPFDSVEAFMHRFESYTSVSALDLVVAYQDSEPIGQTWGWPLTERSRWWEGLLSDLNQDSPRKTAVVHSPCLRSWYLKSGQEGALRVRCMTASCRSAQNRERLF